MNMAGLMELPFVEARLPLLEMAGNNNVLDRKHAGDRTTTLFRRYMATVDDLAETRAATIHCLEVIEGKGGSVTLKIADRPFWDELQAKIVTTTAQIADMETAIIAIDRIIAENKLSIWFDDMKARLNSAGNSIYTQESNITRLTAFFTTQNPRMAPEAVLKLPEYVTKRKEAETIIEKDKANLERFKPIVDEVERVLKSVGC
jgi:hypothetical protein